MKTKTVVAVLTALMLTVLVAAGPARAAGPQNDFQAIQKAVKNDPAYESGKEAKWLKVLVTDAKTNKERVRITLPLALVEMVMNCSKKGPMTVGDDDCEIDLKALWAELKRIGPTALIEVREDDGIIKVWLE